MIGPPNDDLDDVVEWVRRGLAGESEDMKAWLTKNTEEPIHRRAERLIADIWCISERQRGHDHGQVVPCDDCRQRVHGALTGSDPRFVAEKIEADFYRFRRGL